MIITVPRILPWLVVVGGLYLNRERFSDVIDSARDIGKVQLTHQELAGMVTLLRNDSITDPLPAPDAFPKYLRENSKSLDPDRDTGADLWGTPYRLEVEEGGAVFKVRSAGPDRQYETDDDLVAEGNTR